MLFGKADGPFGSLVACLFTANQRVASDGYIFPVFFAVEFLIFLDDLFFFGVDGDESLVRSKKFLQHGGLIGEDISFSRKVKSIVRDGQVLGGVPLDYLVQVVRSNAEQESIVGQRFGGGQHVFVGPELEC